MRGRRDEREVRGVRGGGVKGDMVTKSGGKVTKGGQSRKMWMRKRMCQ